MNIPYRARHFPHHMSASLSGHHVLMATWPELVWSAITAGQPGIGFLFTHGWHSISDIVSRTYKVYANLQQAGDQIEKSSLYSAADPTEKGATSYFIGNMMAKILSARLLGVRCLQHLSMFRTLGGSVTLIGQSEPDFVGQDASGNWIVVEAKGRSNAYDASAMSSAKTQTRQLRRINGAYPILRVAVQAYFATDLRSEIHDPEEIDDDAQDFEGDENLALKRYYSSAIEATRELTHVRNIVRRKILMREIKEVGVTIGLEMKLRERIAAGNFTDVRSMLTQEMPVSDLEEYEGGARVFPDGIWVALDARWSDERMFLDPQQRRTS